jgi:phosphatidylinositol dimannoside acyltransferase
VTSVRSELAQLRGLAVDAGFGAGWSAVKAVPEPLARRGFQLGADLAVRRDGGGVRQLRANLRRVVGPGPSAADLDALVADSMRHYARYWLETFRLPKMDPVQIAATVDHRTSGAQHIDAALAAGRGYVLALPHTGNWDVAGIWLIDRYHQPFTTVAERLKPESLFDRFVAYREGLGMEVVALTGGPRSAVSVLTERLQDGRGICLVADRDLSRQGIDVEFFGETARMPAGPAMLAATTGAPLLPVGTWFTDDGGWGLQIGPPIELTGTRLGDRVRGATQRLADQFAAFISAHPSDWHMLQKFWLADVENLDNVRRENLDGVDGPR